MKPFAKWCPNTCGKKVISDYSFIYLQKANQPKFKIGVYTCMQCKEKFTKEELNYFNEHGIKQLNPKYKKILNKLKNVNL